MLGGKFTVTSTVLSRCFHFALRANTKDYLRSTHKPIRSMRNEYMIR